MAVGIASPEIAASLQAVISQQGDLTLGNVPGSNSFNLLFILGIAAIVTPIVIAEQLIRMDAPIMLVASILVLALALNSNLGLFDSLILLLCLIGYTVFALRQSRAESKKVQNEYAEEFAQKQPRTTRNTLINTLLGWPRLLSVRAGWWIRQSPSPGPFGRAR